MKHIIFILIILAFIFPVKTMGFFATQDKYVHSMPFGVQIEIPADQATQTPIELEQIDNTIKNNLSEPQENPLEIAYKKIVAKNINYFSKNMPWIVFLASLVAVIVAFILLKYKKVI